MGDRDGSEKNKPGIAEQAVRDGLKERAKVLGSLDLAAREAVENARLADPLHKSWIMRAWQWLKEEDYDD